jgi:hypothetical protein
MMLTSELPYSQRMGLSGGGGKLMFESLPCGRTTYAISVKFMQPFVLS